MNEPKTITLYALSSVPMIKTGDNIAEIICDCATKEGFSFRNNDVVVVASKIISKAEGRTINLNDITPSAEGLDLAEKSKKDPRLCELYIKESQKIFRVREGVVVTIDRLGFNSTSAGIDRSNTGKREDGNVSLLPLNPDASAKTIRDTIQQKTRKTVAVIINDSFGRPYREGSVRMLIGLAGIATIENIKKQDLYDNEVNNQVALSDELSSAASILMGQADEARPVVIIRGVDFTINEQAKGFTIIRPVEQEINR